MVRMEDLFEGILKSKQVKVKKAKKKSSTLREPKKQFAQYDEKIQGLLKRKVMASAEVRKIDKELHAVHQQIEQRNSCFKKEGLQKYRIIKSFELPEDYSFPSGTYILNKGVEIKAKDCILRIMQGTVFKFNDESRIYVEGGGFYAVGEKDNQVKFLPAKKGAIGNISIIKSPESLLEHCIVKGLTGSKESRGLGTSNGGPIYVAESKLHINMSEFMQNITASESCGGAISLWKGSLNVHNSKFIGNRAYQGGGAISITSGGTVNIIDSSLLENRADWGGGLFLYIDAKAYIKNTRFERNIANERDKGGAIDASLDCYVELDKECTLRGNSKPQIEGYDSKWVYPRSIVIN